MIPLSTRIRPLKLEDFTGQEHFLYKGSLFFNSIKKKNFDSAIFFGPSGTGKTTLARIIAKETEGDFVELNGATSGIKELKDVIKKAEGGFYGLAGKSTYVYVDEIHRWNKLQQDTLLQALEEGVIKFIGSTTENPHFSINNAVLSRVGNMYEFRLLTYENIKKILLNGIKDVDRGLGKLNLSYEEEALNLLSVMSGGDARRALDTLGFIVFNMNEGQTVDEDLVREAMQKQAFSFQKEDDGYDLLSALQKSVRGSDPDGAIFYLAKMFEGGMDLMTIGRRLMVMACEDIGMAYPQAVSIVTSCVNAADRTGFPEAEIILAQAVILMASCPKSNSSYMALQKAKADIRNIDTGPIPDYLRDSHYKGAEERGFGIGYKYPHEYGGWVNQEYLPQKLVEMQRKYYYPNDRGSESGFKKYLETLENLKKKGK